MIYAAALSYALMNKLDMEVCSRFATIAYNFANKTLGSTLSIPLLSDIISYYESKFGKLPLASNKDEGANSANENMVGNTPSDNEVNNNNAPTA